MERPKAHDRIEWNDRNNHRTGGDSPEENERHGLAAATTCHDPSLTQQHFTEDADVNTIAHRFGLDKGPLPHVPLDPRYYGDVSDVPDLRTALDLVRDAENKFNELPPRLRARFDNLPGKLWDFVNDPDNWDEAVRLGLLQRPPEPPAEAPPVTTVAPPKTP